MTQKNTKKRIFTRYDIKLSAYKAVRIDNWIVLWKLNPRYYVRTDGSLDLCIENKIVETSRGILSIKKLNGLVGRNPQYVTLICSYSHLNGKLIDVGKTFGL